MHNGGPTGAPIQSCLHPLHSSAESVLLPAPQAAPKFYLLILPTAEHSMTQFSRIDPLVTGDINKIVGKYLAEQVAALESRAS